MGEVVLYTTKVCETKCMGKDLAVSKTRWGQVDFQFELLDFHFLDFLVFSQNVNIWLRLWLSFRLTDREFDLEQICYLNVFL